MNALMRPFKQDALLRLFLKKQVLTFPLQYTSIRLLSLQTLITNNALQMAFPILSLCVCLSLHTHTAWCFQGFLLKDNFGIVELVLRSLQSPPHHLQGQPDTSVTSKIVCGGRLGGTSSVSNKVPFFRWRFSLTLKSLPFPGMSMEQNWGDITTRTSGLHLGWWPTYDGPRTVVLQSGPHLPFHFHALLLAARTPPCLPFGLFTLPRIKHIQPWAPTVFSSPIQHKVLSPLLQQNVLWVHVSWALCWTSLAQFEWFVWRWSGCRLLWLHNKHP